MQRLLTSMAALAFVAGLSSGASAKTCRDTYGKFVKCPPSSMSMTMKHKSKSCRDAKGKFTKCKTMDKMDKM